MERGFWKDKEYYASEIMENFELEKDIRLASGKELYCPDPLCENKLLKYCHGDKRKAYFAHINNEKCDYGKFDKSKRMTSNIRVIQKLLYAHLKDLGHTVQLEQKILPHHYTHILMNIENKPIAIEIRMQSTTARDISFIEKNYKENGIEFMWVVISKNHEHAKESNISYLKRYNLNEATNNDIIIIDEKGQKITQVRMDINQYYYENQAIREFNEKKLYTLRGNMNDLILENGKLTLKDFYKNYENWLQEKQNLFKQEVNSYNKLKENKKIEERVIKENFNNENEYEYICQTIEEIELHITQQKKQVRDKDGKRWVKCKECGKIAKVSQFNKYGQEGINIGTCNECKK